ncbi:hypothetical protein CDAR_480611 [Caerostris darwini]|uniref:Uncharacterized protein n=1 Tax=Caerostris darwini TaxID=1538125 RepID=A0AAV4V088_9ARAC|nr:hypothetical protein CDAR_480611 [Caerostris darwini]
MLTRTDSGLVGRPESHAATSSNRFSRSASSVPEEPHGGVPLPAVRDAREEDHQDTGHGPEVHSEGPAGEVRSS